MFAYITVYGLLGLAVILWGIMFARLMIAFRLFRMSPTHNSTREPTEMPSVTVCIPARNEVHSLVDCLERVIASNYPKLEIIVLDDESRDDTPNLIKSFASSGVRFVEGQPLPDGWLGKNFALHTLSKEASGSIIFFMDVDARIEPDTIGVLVNQMTAWDADMLSVLPRRNDGWRLSVLFSPLRFFWELIFNSACTPSTASGAWLIKRSVLIDQYQGFEDWKLSIQPETMLAAALSKVDKYHFLIGTKHVGLAYEKKWRSQLLTSIRLLYPLLGGKLYRAIGALIATMLLIVPLLFVLQGMIGSWHLEHSIAAGVTALYIMLYGCYTLRVWRRGALLGALLWPLIIVQEFILIIVSLERYMRGVVTWRGRPVRARQAKSDVLPTLKAD